jgi:hypothetical protein
MSKNKKRLLLITFLLMLFAIGTFYTATSTFAKKKSSKCTDSDKGINYYKKGKAKGIYVDAVGNTSGIGYIIGKGSIKTVSGTKTTYYDHCANGNQLNEGYCSKGKLTAKGYFCPKGCKNGACIK